MDERGRRVRAWIVASGVAAGATLAGIGVAAAQSDNNTTTTAPAAGATTAPARQAGPGRGGHGGPGGRHKGPGMGGIHGEFVTAKQGGGYQTIATQVGEVTAVSGSSVTVKSEDGFSKAYSVDDNTMVNAGNNGIDDVKKGDTVHVMAIKDGDKYHAVDVMDQTQGQRIGEQFRPAHPAKSAGAMADA
ncbi:MAG: hypothetical protein H0W70_00985 [Actinobacteria bacterium]|nr:hypothetical protein [Actinomycetota bacterium]